MINPYEFNIGSLRVIVCAPTKDEATRIFSESLEEYDTKVKADAIDEFVYKYEKWTKLEKPQQAYYWTVVLCKLKEIAEQLKEKKNDC